MSEEIAGEILGHRVVFDLDHARALALVTAAGLVPARIPPGCNTVYQHFRIAQGHHALLVRQRGFVPLQSDDERPVNGALALILLDADDMPPADAHALLDRMVDVIERA